MGKIIAKHESQQRSTDDLLAGKKKKVTSRFGKLDLGFDGQQDSTLTPRIIQNWPVDKICVFAAIIRRLDTKVSVAYLAEIDQGWLE
jgi:hypothetical protein